MTDPAGVNRYEAPRTAETAVPRPPGSGPREWNPMDALTYAFNRIKKDPMIAVVLFVSWLPGGLIGGFGGVVQGLTAQSREREVVIAGLVVYVVCALIDIVVSVWIALGVASYALKKCRGQETGFGDVFSGGPLVNGIVMQILLALAVCVGLVFCIVPGVYLALAWFPAVTLIVDRRTGPLEALSQTWALTTGQRGNLFILWLLILCLGIAAFVIGALACLIGLLVTLPVAGAMVALATAYVYLKLNGEQPVEPAI